MTRSGRAALAAALVLLILAGVLVRCSMSGDDRPGGTPVPTIAPSPTPPTSAPTTSPTSPPPTACARTPLTVVTFNIHAGVDRSGTVDLRRIAEEIRAMRADVVLLQEVERDHRRSGYVDEPRVLGRLTGLDVHWDANSRRAGRGRPGRPGEVGNAVLTDLPVERYRHALLPNQPGLQRRGLQRVTLEVGGQAVDVFNTHLQHTRGDIRLVQLRAIRRVVARSPRPHLLGGDLNATPDSAALALARRFLDDPWPRVGTGDGLTVPPRAPRRRVDYVLHGPSLEPIAADTVQSAVSDHRAVRVRFDLLSPAGCAAPRS